jgi:hypothetical protein
MSGTTISTTITQTVTLGSASYASPLTLTAAAAITPSLASATGITSTLAASYLDNLGIILGAAAASPTNDVAGISGFGLSFAAGGTLVNAGTISSGAGAISQVGLYFASTATIINTGFIGSGYGSYVVREAVFMDAGAFRR